MVGLAEFILYEIKIFKQIDLNERNNFKNSYKCGNISLYEFPRIKF